MPATLLASGFARRSHQNARLQPTETTIAIDSATALPSGTASSRTVRQVHEKPTSRAWCSTSPRRPPGRRCAVQDQREAQQHDRKTANIPVMVGPTRVLRPITVRDQQRDHAGAQRRRRTRAG